MAKKSALFGDFNTAEGSYNLFENAMRKAIDFDAYASDLFEAKVLTAPTLITNALLKTNIASTSDSVTYIKTYACMVRIQGNLSTHKFLRDPCSIEDTSTSESRRKAFNLIQQHTKVFIYNDGDTLPKIGQIIEVRLERGSFGSFKVDTAEFVGIKSSDVDNGEFKKRQKECTDMMSNFEQGDFVALSDFNFGEKTWDGRVPPKEEVDRVYEVWLATNGIEGVDPEAFSKCGFPGHSVFPTARCDANGLHPVFGRIVNKALGRDAFGEPSSEKPLNLEMKSTKRDLKDQIRLRLTNQIVPSGNKTLTDENILYAPASNFHQPTAPLPEGRYDTGSRHLYGLAVDFGKPLNESSEAGKERARNSPEFKALQQFAENNLNFKNLRTGKEPWHWSFDGG
tara:strand:+ start:58 stop:1245 length:1188 start_codon:yes stop_codon:yes gene_type:complete